MTYNIVALPGDGIGPEILNGSLSLLEIIVINITLIIK